MDRSLYGSVYSISRYVVLMHGFNMCMVAYHKRIQQQ